MKRIVTILGALAIAAAFVAAPAVSAPGGGGGGGGGGSGGGGGGPPTGGESASNLSFPVILSDGVGFGGLPLDGAWRFAPITNPATECVGESGVTPGTVVDPAIPCYYGRKVTVVSETGEIVFSGDTKVWWLQKRPANFWKALTLAHTSAADKLSVSAVDIGDLLESSPTIATRQIRTEFNLLQSVAATDPEFGTYVVTSWPTDGTNPAQCNIPDAAGENVGCFAAVAMSGAVPGTEQSGNEAQGTDFGPGAGVGAYPGTRLFVDPTTVRAAVDELGTPIAIHAAVYARCARFVIQKIDGVPAWDKTLGRWTGAGVGAPVVNVAAYNDGYSTEINSGGGIVYGYNWNAKTVATGTYRLTFVLDGNDAEGPACTTPSLTEFTSGVTELVNIGENNLPDILYAGDSQLGDEGGLVYIDLALTPKGGGGGGGRR